jgi:putative nucleotidyltransferase with HDIG domain
MIRASALPILFTLAFSLWGFFIVGVQNLFLKSPKEYRRMLYTGLYLGFLVIASVFFMLPYIEGISIPQTLMLLFSEITMLVTVVYIFLFNQSLLRPQKRILAIRLVIAATGIGFVLLLARTRLVNTAYNGTSAYFAWFLFWETLFLWLQPDFTRANPDEFHIIRFLYLSLLVINLTEPFFDLSVKGVNLVHGVGFIGLFFPIYFLSRYLEIKLRIRDNVIMINEILNREKKSYSSSIYLVVNMLESKNSFIRGHSERVSFLASLIANQIGMSPAEMEDLQNASLLHDIGYIGVNIEKFINKGVYSIHEFEQIKRHPVIGAEILSKSSIFSKYAEPILYHHENWNGTGYPSGLKGEKIPLFARIIQIADNFDTITTDKFYRQALSREDAILILKTGSGEEFDPDLVQAFIQSIKVG